jgi:murein DD-endopeptidase MepM/ murein hydrolase activator NlpD
MLKPGRPLRSLLRALIILAVLGALVLLLRPWLRQAVRMVHLLREPAPTVLSVPVEGVERSDLRDTWGAARSEGRLHEGIDIFAPRGTQVLSATHGVVLYRGWNRLGGKTVTVFGPGGIRHYYAHLDQYDAPDNGDWVEPGEVLGYVGDTGNAAGTPPHLHYGIYVPGTGAVNPYPLLHGRPPLRGGRRTRPRRR